MEELRGTRLWPERSLLGAALRAEDFTEGVVAAMRKIQRIIQLQALLFRLQVAFAALAAVPIALAFFVW